jgi:hypothetical protein
MADHLANLVITGSMLSALVSTREAYHLYTSAHFVLKHQICVEDGYENLHGSEGHKWARHHLLTKPLNLSDDTLPL